MCPGGLRAALPGQPQDQGPSPPFARPCASGTYRAHVLSSKENLAVWLQIVGGGMSGMDRVLLSGEG